MSRRHGYSNPGHNVAAYALVAAILLVLFIVGWGPF